ncbi:hypothetical protein SAMN05443270_4329 [Lacrimispora sphenoides]|nr:hypothetical protein SAMN05443270_4329 [Lacrimispora sphenoides]
MILWLAERKKGRGQSKIKTAGHNDPTVFIRNIISFFLLFSLIHVFNESFYIFRVMSNQLQFIDDAAVGKNGGHG